MAKGNSHSKPHHVGFAVHAGQIAPARSVRLERARTSAFLYQPDRWTGLPPRIANAYALFEDKARHAIREKVLV